MNDYQPEPGRNIEPTESKERYDSALKSLDFRREEMRFAWRNALRDGLSYTSLSNIMETRDSYRACMSDFLRIWSDEYNNSMSPDMPLFETKRYEFLLMLHRETQIRRSQEYSIMQPKLLQQKAGSTVMRPWLAHQKRRSTLHTIPSQYDFIYDHQAVNHYWGLETESLQIQQTSSPPPSVDVMDYGLIAAAENTTLHLITDEYTLLDTVCSKSYS